jgi:hypothetical protein
MLVTTVLVVLVVVAASQTTLTMTIHLGYYPLCSWPRLRTVVAASIKRL